MEAPPSGGSRARSLALGLSILVALLVLLAALTVAPPFGEHHATVATDERVVALTFDDGPNPPHTEALLSVLAREGVAATFFMMGSHVRAHPASARAVVAAGHEVGNHSWSHWPLPLLAPPAIREEFEDTDAILEQVGARGPFAVRAPWGIRGVQAAWWFSRNERVHVSASTEGWDWEPRTPEQIAERVLAGVEPGGIILLHDGGHESLAADRAPTVGATEIIIRKLRAQGYRFARVSELLELASPGG